MSHRLFNLATLFSAAAFGLFLIAICVAGSVNPTAHHLNLSPHCHVSLWSNFPDARLVVFDDPVNGPYLGGIIDVVGNPNPPHCTELGDVAGIYFRWIRWPDGRSLFTLALSLWYPLAASALLPTVWFVRSRRTPRRGFPVAALSNANPGSTPGGQTD